MAARVGEHWGITYMRSNWTPVFARWSMFGVGKSLPWKPTSAHPTSSMTSRTT
eukprot:CAMPEP_0115181410 /NCGR_PEP_ID=MMETSP0270-20121206/7416_1 /TAXON_ID=71861 /ORGANISM="Scrippsiella trochoidea, Strain CCMP3099" /LENGTH=52 /DNA_ID=CAMNT_0002594431 /DNA_START=707 /DNA_END=861 /DNA_ORIENTATION=+